MAEALRKRNWAAFAKAYNGPGYAKNQYDTKLAASYATFAAPAPAPAAPKPAAKSAPGRPP